ncbi:MAG: hypothetical protein P8Q36_10815 [Alphaproteobacteria bacterium]|jgi:hypothetical protein|nr:hypothetical protein [Rhodospirillaceae bacterium]MBT6205426.1 hypothetical protein [Rhodospirillaceae bacterium]MBT6511957.1 hypothetical protein [Rhodospirillaceae bacterium]MDG2481341.1 hypothetical protein [Alphaproteobacteria bacterium]
MKRSLVVALTLIVSLATALDDYSSSFPFTDAAAHDFILAINDDQGLISPDQFGPIWIVGPMDDDPTIGEEAMIGEEGMHDRWIWRLYRLEGE